MRLFISRLLTKRGYDYHVLIHSNLKPFKCTRCTAAYRSKQVSSEIF